MKAWTWIRFAQYGLSVIAIIAWGYCAKVWLSARLYQQNNARSFDRELKRKNRAAIPQTAVVPQAGSLVGKLEIPRIGVSVMIMEGTGASELNRAVGHIPGTALPGQHGNVAIAGHRDTFFRPLASIRAGDVMSITTLQGLNRYRVVFTRIVRPDNIGVLYPTGQDTLTLVTCFPFYYVGAAPMRYIIGGVQLQATE